MLLALLAISYILVSWNIKYDYLYPKIILSNQFYGAVILWGINFYFLKIRKIKIAHTNTGSLKYKLFELLDFE